SRTKTLGILLENSCNLAVARKAEQEAVALREDVPGIPSHAAVHSRELGDSFRIDVVTDDTLAAIDEPLRDFGADQSKTDDADLVRGGRGKGMSRYHSRREGSRRRSSGFRIN